MSLSKLRLDYFTLNRTTHYVHVKTKDERIKLINLLIKKGYSFTQTSWADYESCIETSLPLAVDTKNKTIGHMGNVTCAACAATSRVILTIDDFLNHYFNNTKIY